MTTRRAFVTAVCGLATVKTVTAQEPAPTAFEVSGLVSTGNVDEGIFDIGYQFALVAPPQSPAHPHLVKCLHHQVKVRVEPI